MRVAVLLSLLTIFGISSAQATRYLVVVKNHQKFAQMHALWTLGAGNQQMNRFFAAKVNPSSYTVENSLPHIGALVVDSENQLLSQELSSNDVYVEKEVFHPAPQPLIGYHLTQAWDFSLAQPQMELTKKRHKKRKHAGEEPPSAPEEPTPVAAAGTPWGITAIHAQAAWGLSHKGQGARVLILDTGVDRDHPALKGNIEDGRNFVGDENSPYEYADHEGHGTHVSGTVAGLELNDGFTGVAPAAKVLMGRVCSEEGCSNIAVAQGIDWGIAEKVDVISMSLGGDFGTNAEKMATERAEAAGVIVVAASGNKGTNSVSFPAAFPNVIAVGAVDENLKKADFSQWGPQLSIMAPGVAVRSSVPQGTGREAQVALGNDSQQMQAVKSAAFMGSVRLDQPLTLPLADVGLGKTEDFKDKDLSGKLALISRGEITFVEKVKNAMAAHAAGVVLYNNADGVIGGVASDSGDLNIPVVMIEQTVGQQAQSALQNGRQVMASVAVKGTDYATFDGTSMATPHVAGVLALIKATNPQLTPSQVREVLKATANPTTQANDENQYGAGIVDAEKAVAKASQIR
jgi:subtilisin family serine protease